jgi:DNA helicase-2/ATP-dependent DNA helicase PcrA
MTADLNEAQQRAVEHGEGPLLVLAGAGTGKTRVLTHRIAHLIRVRHVPPGQVMAVTFTRKAAEEMKTRLAGRSGRPDRDLPFPVRLPAPGGPGGEAYGGACS